MKNKKLLKNIGIGVILLGGAGLIFIPSGTVIWYLAMLVAILGFVVYGLGGGLTGKEEGDGKNEKS